MDLKSRIMMAGKDFTINSLNWKTSRHLAAKEPFFVLLSEEDDLLDHDLWDSHHFESLEDALHTYLSYEEETEINACLGEIGIFCIPRLQAPIVGRVIFRTNGILSGRDLEQFDRGVPIDFPDETLSYTPYQEIVIP